MTNKDTIKEVMEGFNKFVDVFPGNSGFGGSDPQEPEANWNEEPLEVRKWLTSKLQETFEWGRKEGVQSAIECFNTHPEGEGSWCDTGDDMEWACRSDCVESGTNRANKLL